MAKRILVVDDDPSTRKLVESVLSSIGYQIDLASDGSEVAEKIKAHRPDLIIMDYMMPDVDGVKAVQNILETPAFNKLPVIFLTGMLTQNQESGVQFDIKVKYKSFKTLNKPIDSRLLIKEVAAVIGS